MQLIFSRALMPALLVTLTAGSALAQPGVFQVEPGRSSIAYTITHKLHTAVGTSKQVEGKAALRPDGTLQVMVRAPVISFDSQNSGRDEHMHETMESQRYPLVTFKGVGTIAAPDHFPATVTTSLRGELDFHGRVRPETLVVQILFDSEKHVHATAAFDISLDRYEVDRPSLMLMKIDDACHIGLDLDLRRTE